MDVTLNTARLRLRPWRDSDMPAFAAMNAAPKVMEYFPSTLDRAQSDALAARIREHFCRCGYGLWAIEAADEVGFVGFTGLMVPSFQAHFTPCIEIGWRLAYQYWGRGYATEAARATVEFGFRRLGIDELVSFTAAANQRSRRVMERLGRGHQPDDDFDHPKIEEGHPLRRHVLYRLSRAAWASRAQETFASR